MSEGGQTYYYHYDGLGSVRFLTDGAGQIVQEYSYDAWGNLTNSSGSLNQPYQYVGEHYYTEPNLGLQLLSQRWYDPGVGRFISRDPIGEQGGLNLYEYVRNNPKNNTDSEGKSIDPHTAACLICAAMFAKDIGSFIGDCLQEALEADCNKWTVFRECLTKNTWKILIPESRWEKIIKTLSCTICFGDRLFPCLIPKPRPKPIPIPITGS